MVKPIPTGIVGPGGVVDSRHISHRAPMAAITMPFGVWGATERKTHVRARNGRRELIADYIRFLRMGDERANCIRDRHCHLVEFR
jgi:hypothetical protein